MFYHWLLWQIQACNIWPNEELWDMLDTLEEKAPQGWWISCKQYGYY